MQIHELIEQLQQFNMFAEVTTKEDAYTTPELLVITKITGGIPQSTTDPVIIHFTSKDYLP